MTWTPPSFDQNLPIRRHQSSAEWHVAVQSIGDIHGIDATGATPFTTGSDVVWGTSEHVFKLTAPVWGAEIDAEARHLARVSGRLSVNTPDVVATGELGGWPYIVMTRVGGISLGSIWSSLDRAGRLRLSGSLGSLVKELHSLDDVAADDAATWRSFEVECRDARRRRKEPEHSSALSDQVEPFLERHSAETSRPMAFLHTELLDQHIFVKRVGGRFEPCALIDFADGRAGPVPYEFPALVEFIFKGEPGLLRTFLVAYGYDHEQLTPALSEELLAWGLRHRFGSLARMLEAVEPTRVETLEHLAATLYGVGE